MILKGRVINPGNTEGVALVSQKPISFLGDVNKEKGIVINKESDIYGEMLKDRVLIVPLGRGSTVGAWVIYALKKRGLAPSAILMEKSDLIIASGCIISDIPLFDGFDKPIHKIIKTGDKLRILDNGTVIVNP
ncbi:MAG: aconitase X swivel domain-containing protein [Thermoprotei archaeon]|jgi:predicted aconitase with swiveling domain